MLLTILSLIIFLVYLIFVVRHTGHFPKSLSETYYIIGTRPDGTFNRLKASIFAFMMWAIALLLMPVMLDLTPDNFKFLAFLALTGICFVGAAPEFKDSFEGKVHTTAAICSAIFGILWSIIVGGQIGVCILLLSIAGCVVTAVLSNTASSSRTFWLEMIAFCSVYLTAFIQLF